ncbi:hypothetical protein COL922a_012929 [Colletotrichum nupharicola]|nr:hypothetical protein COL922a_012929 [Colletotrichum nupharicola]
MFNARYQATNKTVHLLAPTSQASINISGRTTYNYAGWTPEDARKPLYGDSSIVTKAPVLIINEISIVENQFFERLSCVMRVI